MLFKIEIIESEPEEAFVYKNPYLDKDILFASSNQASRLTTREQDIQFASSIDKRTAWRLAPEETIAYHVAAGAVIYGKTKKFE